MSEVSVFTYEPPIDDLVHSLSVANRNQAVDNEDFGFKGNKGGIDSGAITEIMRPFAKMAKIEWAPTNQEVSRQGVAFIQGEGSEYNSVSIPDISKEVIQKYADMGLIAPTASEENGGTNMPWALGISLSEIFCSANMSVALGPLLTQGAVEALEAHGSEKLQDTYAKKMTDGTWSGTMQLTEAHAGTDLAQIRTKAEKQPDDTYHLEGDKVFISWGEHDAQENIVHLVLAKTDPDARGTRGISLFVVPKHKVGEDGTLVERNGIECIGVHDKGGIHGSPTCMMKMGEKDPAVGYLIGEKNKGMEYMFTMMNRARLVVARQGVAIAERAIQASTIYANQRTQGDNLVTREKNIPIIKHPDVKRMLLTSKAEITAGRFVCDYAAVFLDRAQAGDEKAQRQLELLTSVAKSGCTDMGTRVTTTAKQIAGGFGFMEESGFPQYLADSQILPIYEGANGVHAMNLLFRQVLMPPNKEKMGSRVSEWLKDVRAELKEMKQGPNNGHIIFREASKVLNALEDATRQLKFDARQAGVSVMAQRKIGFDIWKDKPNELAAVATDYLNLFDKAVGSFLMARSVSVANDPATSQKHKDIAFIYARHVLPEYLTLAEKIKNGADPILSTNMQSFCAELNL